MDINGGEAWKWRRKHTRTACIVLVRDNIWWWNKLVAQLPVWEEKQDRGKGMRARPRAPTLILVLIGARRLLLEVDSRYSSPNVSSGTTAEYGSLLGEKKEMNGEMERCNEGQEVGQSSELW